MTSEYNGFSRVVGALTPKGELLRTNLELELNDEDIFEIVISAGDKNGVSESSRFVVFEIGEELINPENGESLGKFEIVKGTGRVIHVQDKVSRIRSIRTRRVERINPERSRFATTLPSEPQYTTSPIPFKNVKIGDIAKEV